MQDWVKQGRHRIRRIIDPYCYLTALIADMLRCHHIVAAEEQLIVAVADNFLPFIFWIAVGYLRDGLDRCLNVDVSGACNGEDLFTVQKADVTKFIHQHIHANWEPTVFLTAGKIEELDE